VILKIHSDGFSPYQHHHHHSCPWEFHGSEGTSTSQTNRLLWLGLKHAMLYHLRFAALPV